MNSLSNKLSIGSVQFGLDYGISNKNGITSFEEVEEILSSALENGIKIIDTASAYGISEGVLGKCNLDNFRIVSKFINISESNTLETQLNETIHKLKVQHLYGYLSHRPMEVVENHEIWYRLIELKKENRIEKIGFSFNSIAEIEEVLKTGFIPDIIQVPYNFLDDRYEPYMKEFKTKFNTEIHTRSTFLQGLFFMDIDLLPTFYDPIKTILKPIKRDQLAAQLLQYVLNKPFIDHVVIGINTKDQLIENIENSSKNTFQLEKHNIVIPENILTPSNWPK